MALTGAALLGGQIATAAPNETGGEAFVFEVTLAPVCLDGSFPVTFTTDAGVVQGTLAVTTAVTGKVTGTLALDDETLDVKGTADFGRNGHSVKLTIKRGRRDRVTLVGSLSMTRFEGNVKSRGKLLQGATAFSLDVSSADPLVASFEAFVETRKKGKLAGAGTVEVCGEPVALKASGKNGTTYALKLKGKHFHFKGVGDHVPGDAALAWSAKGFGARGSSGVIAIDTTLPPRDLSYAVDDALFETEETIATTSPTVTGDPATSFEITGTLPPGLAFDTQTGTISGTPTTVWPKERLTVTARNMAGTASTRLDVTVRRNRMYSLARQQDLTDADLRHFLTRTQWGVEEAALDDARSRGLGAFTDDMLALQRGTSWEQAARIDELQDSGDPQALVPNTTEVTRWWQNLMLTTETPFQEVLAFFWSDLFAVGNQDIQRGGYMVDYVDLLRHEGSGNLRDLLLAMARHPAMLRYLNGDQNRRQAPNENFGREFWELFTLGADNGYTQEDIVQASRAFTGWRERSRVVQDYPDVGRTVTTWFMEFDDTRHDVDAKTIFGVTIPGQNANDDYAAVVDTTLAERDPEFYISRKLLEHFVMDDPPDELVTELGNALRDNSWELAPTLRTMFLSEAFFSSRARGAFVKSPVEFGVGFIRTTGLQVRTSSLDSSLSVLGMRPTQPPVVDGWPTGSAWLSAQSMVDRTNLALTVVNDVNRQNEAGIDVLDILPPPGERGPTQIVNALADHLQVTLNDDERAVLADFLITVRQSNGDTVPSTLTEENIDDRVRGLLYILAQHPTYHIR